MFRGREPAKYKNIGPYQNLVTLIKKCIIRCLLKIITLQALHTEILGKTIFFDIDFCELMSLKKAS